LEIKTLVIAILGGGTLGLIITKILDVVWFNKTQHTYEHNKWLKEKRLEVFSELISHLGSLEFLKNDFITYFHKSHSLASKAKLLIDNTDIIKKIDKLITDSCLIQVELIQKKKLPDGATNKHSKITDEIASELKIYLINDIVR